MSTGGKREADSREGPQLFCPDSLDTGIEIGMINSTEPVTEPKTLKEFVQSTVLFSEVLSSEFLWKAIA